MLETFGHTFPRNPGPIVNRQCVLSPKLSKPALRVLRGLFVSAFYQLASCSAQDAAMSRMPRNCRCLSPVLCRLAEVTLILLCAARKTSPGSWALPRPWKTAHQQKTVHKVSGSRKSQKAPEKTHRNKGREEGRQGETDKHTRRAARRQNGRQRRGAGWESLHDRPVRASTGQCLTFRDFQPNLGDNVGHEQGSWPLACSVRLRESTAHTKSCM